MNTIESILQFLIDNLDEGIQIVDTEGRTVYYNETMAKMEGLNKEEVIGKKVVEYLKGVEEDSSTLMNALKTGEKYIDVIQHYSSHYGKKITTINTTIPITINNKVIAALEISKDMTTLKELNEKLLKLQTSNVISVSKCTFKDIIGNNEGFRKAINKAMKASLTNSSVLIYGETGSGKELFAQSIHYSGLRKDKPFIPINCAAIPSSLLEALLFGTVKGSFTGAENKKGIFEEAHGGTILLDEINSMDTILQSKLLRVLQDGYLRPIGSSSTIDVDVRIIATLNEEPEKLIREGKLRKDFFYRLSVVRIDVPPLRERKEDISLFVDYYIKRYNEMLYKEVEGIDIEVLEDFMQYDWPGNVRELKNLIESAMNMVDNRKILTKEYFEGRNKRNQMSKGNNSDAIELNDNLSLQEHLDMIEKAIIKRSLRKNKSNISKTAEDLKISRQSLQYKLKRLQLP